MSDDDVSDLADQERYDVAAPQDDDQTGDARAEVRGGRRRRVVRLRHRPQPIASFRIRDEPQMAPDDFTDEGRQTG